MTGAEIFEEICRF